MKKNTRAVTVRWVTVVSVALIMIFLGVGIAVVLEHTVLNRWLFFGIMLLAGIVTSVPCGRFWQWLTGGVDRRLCVLIHIVCFGILLSALILGVNYFSADFDHMPRTDAVIVRKYSETRYHSRRVGRRSYSRVDPYKVYYVELALPDSLHREYQISLKRYNRLRKGKTVEVPRGPGRLGIEVIGPIGK